jgi:hypothetical protein
MEANAMGKERDCPEGIKIPYIYSYEKVKNTREQQLSSSQNLYIPRSGHSGLKFVIVPWFGSEVPSKSIIVPARFHSALRCPFALSHARVAIP